MNILEAFKSSNCGKVKINSGDCDEMILDRKFINNHVGLCLLFREDWEPVNDPLTFERIRKECVTGETLLIDKSGDQRLYLGFNRKAELVTDYVNIDGAQVWGEHSIENWRIGGKWEQPNDA